MTKPNKKFVQPGCLSQEKTKYEKVREKTMAQNAAFFESLGIKSLANGLLGSNPSAKEKSGKVEKKKLGSGNDDEEYQPVEGEEGMSSSSEDVVSSRLRGNKVCMAPKKKKGGYNAHISRDSEPHDTSIPIGETQVVPRQALTPLVDHVQSVTTAATQPTQLHTLSAQPHQLPSSAPTSVVVKKRGRGPTRGKRMDKVRKELGHPIYVEIDCVARKLVGEHSTAAANALREQIRDHAPVRDILWKAIDFGIRESIVVRVGQTFDIGDYKNDMVSRETIDRKCQGLYKEWKSNLYKHYLAMKEKVAEPKNHALSPCKPEDWVFMIDNVWETKDFQKKSERGKNARSEVKLLHTSGSRSFISLHSMMRKEKGKNKNIAEMNIAEKFEITHKRHRHGGEWINEKAQERHAQLEAKLKEQSQPNVTNPSSERQISIDVLGKRSVYAKEYASCRSTISSFNQPEEPNPEVTVLQKKVEDQAKTLTKHNKTMTVFQGLIQVLAIKAGVDPTEVQKVIDRCNNEANTSGGEEDGEVSISGDDNVEASISGEKDDETST